MCDISTHINIIYTARCRCDVCTRWMMEAVESRGKEAVSRLEVGFWTPAGPHLKDDLFPHVKGNFRGRVIPIASVHVSYSVKLYFMLSSLPLIQYPPWQNLIKDDSGKIIGKSGLIFEVLNQISHKLNFSYSVREPADGKWGVRSGAGEWNGMIRHLHI